MQFQQLTGPPKVVECYGCHLEFTAGTDPDVSASGRPLDPMYQDPDTGNCYCESCAAKVTEYVDPTRSISQFYADTTGTVKE